MNLYLGIDFGTTGARSTVIDSQGTIHYESKYTFAHNGQQQTELPSVWENALWDSIEQIPPTIRNQVRAIALDGTSSTIMLYLNKSASISLDRRLSIQLNHLSLSSRL
ncbi:hypothetical protein [Microcoleus sp.]|uniref:hypothetical protein n=1 Tax=Microcoleus sp. TaxID=44472 RepID=UPI00403EE217